MERKIRKNSGITLITLIVTIVVMLILVAVSVRVVKNSDLIGVAKQAGKLTEEAKEKEQSGAVTIEGKEYASIEDYMAGKAKIKAGEKAKENSPYETAVIPAGFTVSGNDEEKTVENGLVIYLIDDLTDEQIADIQWNDEETIENLRQTYDQFVWIPISHTQINDMYICQGKTEDNGECNITVENGVAQCTNEEHSNVVDGVNKNTLMAGYLYSDNAMTTKYKTYTEGSNYREPDTVSYDGYDTYLGDLSDILEPGVKTEDKVYTSEAKFKAKLQEEYNEVVKSVYENEGFYVGRYETSGLDEFEANIVKGRLPSVKFDWYRSYAYLVKYADDNDLSVGSTMIQGTAYDQVMKFVNGANDGYGYPYYVTSFSSSRHTGSIGYTGVNLSDKVKNLYDLEGNATTWTSTADSGISRVIRGYGCFKYQEIPATYHSTGSPQAGYGVTNALIQLYVIEKLT